MVTLSRLIDSKQGKAVFQQAIRNPCPKESVPILFEPAATTEANPTTIGHAYDMWARCWMGRHLDIVQVDPRQFMSYRHSSSQPPDEAALERAFTAMDEQDALDVVPADPRAEQAAATIESWLAGSVDERATLEACLVLARFEMTARSGQWVEATDVRDSEIEELKRLIGVTKTDWLEQARAVALNPVLGQMKGLRGISADADLFVDGELVELKTGRKRKMMDDWRQLAGYVVLNDMSANPLPINGLAVYYVRFGRRWNYPVDEVFEPGGRERIRELLEKGLG